MGDEPFTTQHRTSSTASRSSTSPHHAAYAAQRAKLLFGCYRRGDANDPDTYVAAVAAVLSRFDPDLVREVTDPNTGIQTTEKYMSFMPNAGELKVYCDAIDAARQRIKKLAELPRVDFNRQSLPAPAPAPGDKATIFVPADNSEYEKLLEWSKTADPRLFKFEQRPGIWVSYDTWENRRTVTRVRPEDRPTSMQLSEIAQRTMAQIDAERSHNLPADHASEVV
jgi:hypothetical protein